MTMRTTTGCADEGRLRAVLDGEAQAGERADLGAHLAACPACAARLAAVRADRDAVAPALAAWLPERVADAPTADAGRALARFRASLDTGDLTAGDDGVAAPGLFDQAKEWVATMRTRLNSPRLRPVLGATALLAVLALVLTLSPVASLADQLTKTFRVQQFQAITVRVPGMKNLPQLGAGPGQITPEQLAQFQALLAPLGTPTTNATPQSAREVADQAAARAFLAGHGSKLYAPGQVPAAFSGYTARYGVADPTSSTYALNVQTAKQYLAMMNSPELNALPWPAGVDQMTFGLDTPAAVLTFYGDIAAKQGFGVLQMAVLNSDTPGAGPALKLPAELDANAFRAALLALPGLPADTVAQLKAVKDWERTLIIPVPEDATTRNVSIKGNAGLLIADAQGQHAFVVWQQGGMLFAVGGTLTEAEALALANGLVQVP